VAAVVAGAAAVAAGGNQTHETRQATHPRKMAMFRTMKIAVAAALFAAAGTAVSASEFDGNLANRYPAYAQPRAGAWQGAHSDLQSAPVRLSSGRRGTVRRY
jgi:hypothetical protein